MLFYVINLLFCHYILCIIKYCRGALCETCSFGVAVKVLLSVVLVLTYTTSVNAILRSNIDRYPPYA